MKAYTFTTKELGLKSKFTHISIIETSLENAKARILKKHKNN